MRSMKKHSNTKIKNQPDKGILQVAESSIGWNEGVEKVNKTKYNWPV